MFRAETMRREGDADAYERWSRVAEAARILCEQEGLASEAFSAGTESRRQVP